MTGIANPDLSVAQIAARLGISTLATALTSLASGDLLIVEDVSAGRRAQITRDNLAADLAAATGITGLNDHELLRADGTAAVQGSGAILTDAGDLTIADDTDRTLIVGRMRMDSRTTDRVYLSHRDQTGGGDFALVQLASGQTAVNAPTGQSVLVQINNTSIAAFSSTGMNIAAGKTLTHDGNTILDASRNLTVVDATITGDLHVQGTTVTHDTDNVITEDPLVKQAKGNTADLLDIGFYGAHDGATTEVFCGLFRDANDGGTWKLFDSLQVEPTTTVDTGGAGYALADLSIAGLQVSEEIVMTGTTKHIRRDDQDGQLRLLGGSTNGTDSRIVMYGSAFAGSANEIFIDSSRVVFSDMTPNVLFEHDGSVFKVVRGTVRLQDTTDATDATGATGSLGTLGGASVKKALYVGGATTIGDGTGSSTLTVDVSGTAANILVLQADLGANDRNMLIRSPATDSASDAFQIQTANSFEFVIDAAVSLRIPSSGSGIEIDALGDISGVGITVNDDVDLASGADLIFNSNARIIENSIYGFTFRSNDAAFEQWKLQDSAAAQLLILNFDPGSLTLFDNSTNEIVKFTGDVAFAVNYTEFVHSATGNAVELKASGGDTDIDIKLAPKGSGTVNITSLPTSSAGLNTGDLWNDSGTVKVA